MGVTINIAMYWVGISSIHYNVTTGSPRSGDGAVTGGYRALDTKVIVIVWVSVATVMTDVFHKNEINLLRKFAEIARIFDKIDDPKNRGVI